MMLRPTQSQKYLSKLRTLAAKQSLLVQSCVDSDHIGENLCHYMLRITDDRVLPQWSLRKLAYEHEGHFAGAWDWQAGKGSLGQQAETQIKELLKDMPSAFRALGVNRLGAFVCCSERSLGSDVDVALQKIQDNLDALVAAIQA